MAWTPLSFSMLLQKRSKHLEDVRHPLLLDIHLHSFKSNNLLSLKSKPNTQTSFLKNLPVLSFFRRHFFTPCSPCFSSLFSATSPEAVGKFWGFAQLSFDDSNPCSYTFFFKKGTRLNWRAKSSRKAVASVKKWQILKPNIWGSWKCMKADVTSLKARIVPHLS